MTIRAMIATLLLTWAPAMPLAAQSEPDVILRVGKGGLTQDELDVYYKRAARTHRGSWRNLSEDERAQARRQAIDDEILFQEAVKAGLLRDPLIRQNIIDRYESAQTTAKIRPNDYTADEIRAFYEANKRDFMSPPQALLRAKMFPKGTPRREITKASSTARRAPDSLEGWQKVGWARPGDTFRTPLQADDLEILFTLRKGQVSKPFRDAFGTQYLFIVDDVKPARQLPLRQVRAKVIHHMINAEKADRTAQLDRRLGIGRAGNRKSAEEVKLDAAIAARTHRSWSLRKRIINTFVARQDKSAEELLPPLRKKYRVAAPPR